MDKQKKLLQATPDDYQNMKLSSAFAVAVACLVATSSYFQVAEAGMKKKLLGALLVGAALASKPKFMPLPLPVPVSELFVQLKQT